MYSDTLRSSVSACCSTSSFIDSGSRMLSWVFAISYRKPRHGVEPCYSYVALVECAVSGVSNSNGHAVVSVVIEVCHWLGVGVKVNQYILVDGEPHEAAMRTNAFNACIRFG